MIYLLHWGSTPSFKTMHSDNEKQAIPTPLVHNPLFISYAMRN